MRTILQRITFCLFLIALCITTKAESTTLSRTAEIHYNSIGNNRDGWKTANLIESNIHPILQVNNVSTTQPTACSRADGSIAITINGESDQCVELSIDGGLTYLPNNQLTINNLSAGAYSIYLRYCDEMAFINGGIVNLSDPTEFQLKDDVFSGYCPGVLLKGNVADNDTLVNNILFSIPVNATYGRVQIAETGEFTYIPIDNICGSDQFAYQVCEEQTGCCATATVTIEFGDTNAPTFGTLPTDITIDIADEIPLPAAVQTFDNCPTTELDFKETTTKDGIDCGKHDYTITRTWTATDQCGNEATHIQAIEVVDEIAPDIFRIHILPNGKKVIAGVMEFTSEHWKTIPLPIDFGKEPIIFTQLITNNEATPTTIRLKNITPTQFQIKLQEEAANDGLHQKESVAWIAMERGTQTEGYQLQVDTISTTHSWATIPFFQKFNNIPLFFANMQTINDEDVSTLRNSRVNWNNAKVRVQEENSEDLNSAHRSETTGYLAIDNAGDLTNETSEKIGEVGRVKVSSDWVTIPLKSVYNNPVIIANSLSIDHFDQATVRIKNVTTNTFDIRVEEWDYLDGKHGIETVSYLVIEGSLPLAAPNFCEAGRDEMDILNELIALDNTQQFLPIAYNETFDFSGTEQLTHRHWSAIDLCGNEGIATQTVACPGIAMKGKAILQGALIGSESPDLMRDDLRQLGIIPLTEPYTELANFQHIGSGGGEFVTTELLAIEGKNAIVDWLFLELRNKENQEEVVATAAALLQRDGDIVSFKGDSLIVFASAPQGNYYIAVRHRNHLGMLGNSAQEFSSNSIPFMDFTNVLNTTGVHTGNSNFDKNSMWSGDLNSDGRIIYQGPNNDIFNLFLHILQDANNTKFLTNFISNGYTENDFNLDGKTIYQGPNNDRSALLFNTILVHPENKQFFSNFILEVKRKGE